jgi:signal transduction histidine kinase
MLFAFSLIALRYGRNSSPLLPLVVLGLLCLFVADALYLILSWAPGGHPSQVAILPLYTLHSILLALAAYRDVTHIPTETSNQPSTMPITEWLLWVLVPLVVMIAAFTAASVIGDAPLVLVLVLAVVGIAHEMLAMFDYRRVTFALYQARIEAEDLAAGAERNRVAGELHDNLTRYLTITNMQLQGANTLLSRNPDQARRSVQTAQQMTVKALTAVQQSVAALRNSPIDDRPLPEIIHDLAAESQLVDIHTEVIVVGDPHPLSMDTKAVLFRAAQEGLTNIRKHAHATHANLILDSSDSMCVRLVIQDNGQGGNPVSGGMGLAIMRERTARVGGKVGIDTTPGDGFTIEIEVPRCT